jgi:hypothetical protein
MVVNLYTLNFHIFVEYNKKKMSEEERERTPTITTINKRTL